MACLVNDFASFDTPEDPGGASIVERKDFQAKRPLWEVVEKFLNGIYYLIHSVLEGI